MSASSTLQPDPSVIGGVAPSTFALPPDPGRLFAQRAERFARLAPGHELSPYLQFLAGLSQAQAAVVAEAPAPQPVEGGRLAQAAAAAMPPIDRARLADDPAFAATIAAFLARAEGLAMPAAAAAALARLRQAPTDVLGAMAAEAPGEPGEDLAGVLFVEAGAQVYAARLAATLQAPRLTPVGTGLCPACGGLPVASVVVGFEGAEGARYAVCSFCATAWNEVRIKCLACGSTKGIGYRAAGAEGAETDVATVKAEVCEECGSWLKIFYQNKNPSLEAVADDVGTLGLDVLMRDTAFRRAGHHPFALGY